MDRRFPGLPGRAAFPGDSWTDSVRFEGEEGPPPFGFRGLIFEGELPPMPEGTLYTCPMDPEVRQKGPGACPKCGMALELFPDIEPFTCLFPRA